MKIAFLHKYPFPYFGIMSLSATLPARHRREVFVGDLEKDVAGKVVAYRPEVIAVPLMALEYHWALETLSRIKNRLPEAIVVAGYIHAVSRPEIIEHPLIDAVCLGEGEYSFPDLLDRFEQTGKLGKTDGFWVKEDGRILKSERSRLVPDLDALPDEDRALYYDKYPVLARDKLKHFMASRGCPFSCFFCCHQVYRRLYRGRGGYVRRRSPSNTVRQVKEVVRRWGAHSLCFLDDVFVMDAEWLRKFSEHYRSEIGLPYFCAVTPQHMTEEIAALLADSGCRTVNFGVETADEKKRFEVLNKRVTDAQIFECARLVKKHGMKIQTTMIFGLPFETVDEAFGNISFNIRLGTDFMASNILLPFPGTRIEKIALEAGILAPDYLNDPRYRGIHLESVFKFRDIEVIERVQKISHLAVKFPFLLPLFRKMVRMKSQSLFFLVYVATSMWRYKSEKPISWLEVMKVFWRSRKNYLNSEK